MSNDTGSTCPALPARYERLAEIGRGGMGVVWSARDLSLDRRLAIKTLLPAAAASAEHQSRSVREARITGSLQHPGIPPVVECGELENGLPFFSMKLVEGRTLADLLAERSDSKHDLSHFLGIYEQVCHAVGYAHSRGVIHRDLKPANVMVGAFGEVQVMDWGMAKRVLDSVPAAARPGNEATMSPDDTRPLPPSTREGELPTVAVEPQVDSFDATIQPVTLDIRNVPTDSPDAVANEASPAATQMGSVMGTPAYMPPEQARGEIARLDARSDVFSLGAILYEILTGRRVYAGKDCWHQIVRGDLAQAFEQLDQSAVPDVLIDLCRTCLSVHASDRPANGSLVADAVRTYEEGVQQRLQQEQVERATAEARAVEQQKRAAVERSKRQMTVALAGAVLLLTIGGGGAIWWYQQDRMAKKTAAEIRARQATDDINSALVRAAELRDRSQFAAASTFLAQAEQRLAELPVSAQQAGVVQQAKSDLRLVQGLENIRLGKATWTNDGFDKAFASGSRGAYARKFRELGFEILGDDSPESVGQRIAESDVSKSLLAALDDWALDDKEHRQRLIEIARVADQDSLQNQIRNPANWTDAEQLVAFAKQSQATKLSPAAATNLAFRLALLGETGPATVVIIDAVVRHPDDFWLRFTAAELLESEFSEYEAALGHLEAAVAIQPGNATALNNLGLMMQKVGRMNEAEAVLRRAIDVDSRHAVSYANLASLLHKNHQERESLEMYRRAIDINPDYSAVYSDLGLLLVDLGGVDEAEAAYRQAINTDANNGRAYSNLGQLLEGVGRLAEAEQAYRTGSKVEPGFVGNHYNLGNLLVEANRLTEAEAAYRQAIAADSRFPNAYCNLGNLLFNHTNRLAEAAELLTRGHELGSQDPDWDYPSKMWLDRATLAMELDQRIAGWEKDPTSVDDPEEGLNLADFAFVKKKQPWIAARLYQTFLDDAAVPPPIRFQLQYPAACAAVLGAAGDVSEQDTQPDAQEAAALRRQALTWLQASLNSWEEGIQVNSEARKHGPRVLGNWLEDPDLAAVRDPQRLAELSAEERAVWEEFWSEVRRVIQLVDD